MKHRFRHEIKTVPSLGIEIEIPIDQVVVREDRQRLHDPNLAPVSQRHWLAQQLFKQAEVHNKYQPRIDAAIKRGIPIDKFEEGVLVEFAHKPTIQPRQLIEEVQSLYDDALLTDDETYPLHVTVGGIDTNHRVDILLRSMEITGQVPSSRLRETYTWNISGLGGVRPRATAQLGLGYRKGTELRTPILQSTDQLSAILTTAQIGAHAIMNDPLLWEEWETRVTAQLTDAHLPAEPWRHRDTSTWNAYANLLDDPVWRSETEIIVNDLCQQASVTH